MRTIERRIVGAFVFSSDNKILLGKNKAGGVYRGQYVVPGGGVEGNESDLNALKRELLEETGIDLDNTQVCFFNCSNGECSKVLSSGETVLVKMTFLNYLVHLDCSSEDITVVVDSDWDDPKWFGVEVKDEDLSLPTRNTLEKMGFIK